LRKTSSKVKYERLENSCAKYTGVTGYWKEGFIGFEMSIK
jgi:hypothetical protein